MPSLRRNEKIENIFSSVSPGDSIIPGRGGVAVSGLLSKDGWEGKKFGCHVTSGHFVWWRISAPYLNIYYLKLNSLKMTALWWSFRSSHFVRWRICAPYLNIYYLKWNYLNMTALWRSLRGSYFVRGSHFVRWWISAPYLNIYLKIKLFKYDSAMTKLYRQPFVRWWICAPYLNILN